MSVKKMVVFLCFIFFLLSSSATATKTVCNRCVRKSTASYFYDDSVLSSGACGYGSLALEFSGGYLAAGTASIFEGAVDCGQCFQMRCRNKTLCTGKGTRFIVTDLNHDDEPNFVLSRKAFMAMANKGMGEDILKLGHVDVEYKRVPCKYKNKNLSVRVEESSHDQHLVFTPLYLGGQTDIIELGLVMVGWENPGLFSRSHGAVWEGNEVVDRDMQFIFCIGNASLYDSEWVRSKTLFPINWKPGAIYDTGLKITTIAKEKCYGDSKCDHGHWK